MKYFFKTCGVVLVVVVLSPFLASAQENNSTCSSKGYTIETINGVLTDEVGAADNKKALEYFLPGTYHNEKLNIDYLLNPSHLGKIGDFIMAAYQKFFDESTVKDYDLVEMIKSASEKVQTQKLLLIGHSQGNFYANSMYDVLADKEGGVPAQSLGVYSVATPAQRVAGAGKWLTSDTDKVIADVVSFFSLKTIMKPNTDIILQSGDDFWGHDFANIYLKYKSDEIVSDIYASLDKLKENDVQDAQKPCIVVPSNLTTMHAVEGAALAVGDFVFGGGYFAQYVGTALGNGLVWVGTSVMNTIKEAGSSLLALVYSVPVPPASTLLVGALPPAPAQTLQPSVPSSAPVQGTPSIPAPAPQIATGAITMPSAQTAVSEAVSTSTAVIITASTPEIIAVASPASQGGGSVTGASLDVPTPTITVMQETATSTPDVTATSTSEAVYDPNPVVINEIAWMGTQANSNGEWIELYNRTDSAVDLAGWTLESKNKFLSIELAQTIPARGYFLLERAASTTTDRLESMIYDGALADSGSEASLYLKNGTSTIDSVDFSHWVAGENPLASSGQARKTMERVSPYAEGNNEFNWRTYSESLTAPFAKDEQGNDIFGTPGAKNSVAGFYTPAAPNAIVADTVWRKAYSPYYVRYMLAVAQSATLTIEPGTVVKFGKGGFPYPYSAGGLEVHGVLKAIGTQAAPIIFTSVLDDQSDGIDSNQDATSTSPASADWMRIDFFNTLEPSAIRNAQIRYGGQGYTNANGYPVYLGTVGMYGASPEISDSTFAFNHAVSVYVKDGAHPTLLRNTISDTEISAHRYSDYYGFGVWIADTSSTADIVGNTFKSNHMAILSESDSNMPLVVKDNVFTDNQGDGEFRGRRNFNLDNSGNRDTNNAGGFSVNAVISANQTKTLRADSMPYVSGMLFDIEEGGVLTIEPGTVIKFANPDMYFPNTPLIVHGTLNARGTAERPIVFTSAGDESNGSGVSSQASPGSWRNIQFLGASSSDSVLEHAIIAYGGRGYNVCPYAYFYGGPCMEYKGAVLIDGASPTISQSTFNNNQGVSIYVQGDARPVIKDSVIANTATGTTGPSRDIVGGYGISIGAESQPVLDNNTYSGNVQDVVYR